MTASVEWRNAGEQVEVAAEDMTENHDGILVGGTEGAVVAGSIVVAAVNDMENKAKHGEQDSLISCMTPEHLGRSPQPPSLLLERLAS
jgi:hypothetical protein